MRITESQLRRIIHEASRKSLESRGTESNVYPPGRASRPVLGDPSWPGSENFAAALDEIKAEWDGRWEPVDVEYVINFLGDRIVDAFEEAELQVAERSSRRAAHRS